MSKYSRKMTHRKIKKWSVCKMQIFCLTALLKFDECAKQQFDSAKKAVNYINICVFSIFYSLIFVFFWKLMRYMFSNTQNVSNYSYVKTKVEWIMMFDTIVLSKFDSRHTETITANTHPKFHEICKKQSHFSVSNHIYCVLEWISWRMRISAFFWS